MAAFVFKVLTLGIKTASKPLASRFQAYVLTHPTLRPAVLSFAQAMHKLDFAMSRLAEGKPIGTSKRFVAALDDERAMDLAGKVVSEGFVLAVGIGILGWEYNRNAVKDADKKAKEEAYRKAVDAKFEQCNERLRQQEQHITAMLDAIRKRQEQLEHFAAQMQREKDEHSSWRLWGSKA